MPLLGTGLRRLMQVVEAVAALLIVSEIGLLLTGVVSRYVLHVPIVWVDELASTIFLWSTMLGAVIALDRGEHMRLSAVVARVSARRRVQLETLGTVVVVLFLLVIVVPAHDYVDDESMITTPIMQLSNRWRVLALEAGLGLMLVVALAKLATRAALADAAVALVACGAVGGALWLLAPQLAAMGNLNLLVFFGLVVGACVVVGTPIAFAFGAATVAYLWLTTSMPLTVIVGRVDEGVSHVVLLSVPLFVVLGMLLEITGMARAMVDFLAALLGRVRGGLSYVMLAAMYLVSGISGSKAADMAAIAPVLFPEMKRRDIDDADMVALMAGSAAMSETIPPSLVLITLGSVTGISIAALFVGGLVPALVLAIVLAIFARWRAKPVPAAERKPLDWPFIGRALLVAMPAILLPFLIRAAVVEGVATATEVSTIGIAYAVLVGVVVYRRFAWSRIYPMLVETASLSGAILLIIGMATAMGWALTQSGFSNQLVQTMSHLPGGPFGFLVASIVVFIVLGSVLEGIPAIVLFAPLLFPAAKAVGVHEVHYAMVVVLAMGIGLFAPPVGVGFYGACAIAKVDPSRVMRKVWFYLAALVIGLIGVAAVPWFSIGLL